MDFMCIFVCIFHTVYNVAECKTRSVFATIFSTNVFYLFSECTFVLFYFCFGLLRSVPILIPKGDNSAKYPVLNITVLCYFDTNVKQDAKRFPAND